MRQKTNRAGRRLRPGSACQGGWAPDRDAGTQDRRKQEAVGRQHGGAPCPSAPGVLLPTPLASSPIPLAPTISSALFCSSLPWMVGQQELGCVPALVPDTSLLDPQGSGPRDLSQGPSLSPKGGGVEAGGHCLQILWTQGSPWLCPLSQVCLWGQSLLLFLGTAV